MAINVLQLGLVVLAPKSSADGARDLLLQHLLRLVLELRLVVRQLIRLGHVKFLELLLKLLVLPRGAGRGRPRPSGSVSCAALAAARTRPHAACGAARHTGGAAQPVCTPERRADWGAGCWHYGPECTCIKLPAYMH